MKKQSGEFFLHRPAGFDGLARGGKQAKVRAFFVAVLIVRLDESALRQAFDGKGDVRFGDLARFRDLGGGVAPGVVREKKENVRLCRGEGKALRHRASEKGIALFERGDERPEFV